MLIDLLNAKNESLYMISKKTGIPYSTLNDLAMGRTDIANAQARTVYELARYCDVPMEKIYMSNNENIALIGNVGRDVYIVIGGCRYEYRGPKNLIAFKKINKLVNNVAYIDTYFLDNNNQIYVEEDYVDINDIISDYPIKCMIVDKLIIDTDKKTRILDEALMVSDDMAIFYDYGSADDIQIEVVNTKRMNQRLRLRLNDYAVLNNNMSDKLKKKSIATVKRNAELISMEIKESRNYA